MAASDDSSDKECPLCMEPWELDDINFYPCTCEYQGVFCGECQEVPLCVCQDVDCLCLSIPTFDWFKICRFCWHRLRTDDNGLCPACRQPYPENPVNFKPLSQEELKKIAQEKKQKEQLKKQKLSESRKHLANLRVVQKNLVFVVGLSSRLADPEVLKRAEYFGKFGRIQKIMVNNQSSYVGQQGPSAGAYITFYKADDALRAIQCVNNLQIDGRTMKACLGTTKYCSMFLKNQSCSKTDCMYLHELGDDAASFTKEEMQQGKHTDYEKTLIDQILSALPARGTGYNSTLPFLFYFLHILESRSGSLSPSMAASEEDSAAIRLSHEQYGGPGDSHDAWASLNGGAFLATTTTCLAAAGAGKLVGSTARISSNAKQGRQRRQKNFRSKSPTEGSKQNVSSRSHQNFGGNYEQRSTSGLTNIPPRLQHLHGHGNSQAQNSANHNHPHHHSHAHRSRGPFGAAGSGRGSGPSAKRNPRSASADAPASTPHSSASNSRSPSPLPPSCGLEVAELQQTNNAHSPTLALVGATTDALNSVVATEPLLVASASFSSADYLANSGAFRAVAFGSQNGLSHCGESCGMESAQSLPNFSIDAYASALSSVIDQTPKSVFDSPVAVSHDVPSLLPHSDDSSALQHNTDLSDKGQLQFLRPMAPSHLVASEQESQATRSQQSQVLSSDVSRQQLLQQRDAHQQRYLQMLQMNGSLTSVTSTDWHAAFGLKPKSTSTENPLQRLFGDNAAENQMPPVDASASSDLQQSELLSSVLQSLTQQQLQNQQQSLLNASDTTSRNHSSLSASLSVAGQIGANSSPRRLRRSSIGDDDLGFDPFAESSKGLEDMLRMEQQELQQQRPTSGENDQSAHAAGNNFSVAVQSPFAGQQYPDRVQKQQDATRSNQQLPPAKHSDYYRLPFSQQQQQTQLSLSQSQTQHALQQQMMGNAASVGFSPPTSLGLNAQQFYPKFLHPASPADSGSADATQMRYPSAMYANPQRVSAFHANDAPYNAEGGFSSNMADKLSSSYGSPNMSCADFSQSKLFNGWPGSTRPNGAISPHAPPFIPRSHQQTSSMSFASSNSTQSPGSTEQALNFKDWQDGLRQLFPNVNVQFAPNLTPQQQQQANSFSATIPQASGGMPANHNGLNSSTAAAAGSHSGYPSMGHHPNMIHPRMPPGFPPPPPIPMPPAHSSAGTPPFFNHRPNAMALGCHSQQVNAYGSSHPTLNGFRPLWKDPTQGQRGMIPPLPPNSLCGGRGPMPPPPGVYGSSDIDWNLPSFTPPQ